MLMNISVEIIRDSARNGTRKGGLWELESRIALGGSLSIPVRLIPQRSIGN
jgi:hypothetical protein